MRDPEYDRPAPDQTLREWLASTSADWEDAQPTLWLPAVPAEPRATIPRQRARTRRTNGLPRPVGRHGTHRMAGRLVPDPAGTATRSATPSTDLWATWTSDVAEHPKTDPPGDLPPDGQTTRWVLMAVLLVVAVLAVGLLL